MENINLYQEKWESRSSIRTSPRKIIDFNVKGWFFPPSKQPLLLLPDIINLGEQVKDSILLYSLYKYLTDIINIEVQFIHEACTSIIYDELIVLYSEQTKLNAHTVIIDEYYHVYMARDMMIQLGTRFPNFDKLKFSTSDAYNAVSQIKYLLDPKYVCMFNIIAVCIFETTLVRELVEFFNDKEVHPSIRYYVNDHMNDEAKHYGFFYDLLKYTWINLPDDYQKNIGIHLADFVKLYLSIESEKNYNLSILNFVLKNKNKSQELVDGIYGDFEITAHLPIVQNVLNVLKKTHILDNEFVKNGFIRNKLYIPK